MRVLLISLITAVALILLFSLDQTSSAAVINCSHNAPTCTGTSADDIIFGNGQDQVIHGLNGNDYVRGDSGRTNYIFGDDGADILIGGIDHDGLFGGRGNDKIDGWRGDDSISEDTERVGTFVNNNDVISGAEGDDYINSGYGVDRIEGGPGNDIILPNGFNRDFSFDSVNCGSDTGDRIFIYSGDGETTTNCEIISNFDR
jgi:Ca2+-binding RTX toxin-like protein